MSKTGNAIDQGHKLHLHPERVAEWLARGDCYPLKIEIGPTNRCNHRCSFCALDFVERDGVDINTDVMVSALEEMAQPGRVKGVYFAGEGEVLLHRDFPRFVQVASNAGMGVAMSTNGALLTHEKADQILPYLTWIRFSVDAAEKPTYARVHGTREGDFEKVLEGIRYSAELKRKLGLNVDIGTQAVLLPENSGEMVRLANLMKDAGADNFQVKPYSQHPSSHNHFSVDYSALTRLENDLKEVSTPKFNVVYRRGTMERLVEDREYSACLGLPFFNLITAHGDLIPCNIFYGKQEFVLGNLNKQTFSQIIEGPQRREVIARLNANGITECRKGCPIDAMNRYLDQLTKLRGVDKII